MKNEAGNSRMSHIRETVQSHMERMFRIGYRQGYKDAMADAKNIIAKSFGTATTKKEATE